MSEAIYVERQGTGDTTVLLLHGLGCNGSVWDRVVRQLLSHGFSTIVPDAPGHGRSPWQPFYSAGQLAAELCSVVPKDRSVHVIGHSMGAAVAMLLASGLFGVKVASILAIGMKVVWSEEDMLRMTKVPPLRVFGERRDAAQRFLRITGLEGLVSTDDRCVEEGIRAIDGGFRLAADPNIVAVAGSPVRFVPSYGQAMTVPVRHCCGSADPLVGIGSLRQLDADAIEFEGHGHNVHVSAATDVVDAFLAHALAQRVSSTGRIS